MLSPAVASAAVRDGAGIASGDPGGYACLRRNHNLDIFVGRNAWLAVITVSLLNTIRWKHACYLGSPHTLATVADASASWSDNAAQIFCAMNHSIEDPCWIHYAGEKDAGTSAIWQVA